MGKLEALVQLKLAFYIQELLVVSSITHLDEDA